MMWTQAHHIIMIVIRLYNLNQYSISKLRKWETVSSSRTVRAKHVMTALGDHGQVWIQTAQLCILTWHQAMRWRPALFLHASLPSCASPFQHRVEKQCSRHHLPRTYQKASFTTGLVLWVGRMRRKRLWFWAAIVMWIRAVRDRHLWHCIFRLRFGEKPHLSI